ncbi:uncharacterized protein BP5553_02234 [Venustampulla echinocandica]|uniref:Uncharacterized protein n=1 Tax=Venustampulla echinocandica TaxID=2656787 RepID=A0A370U3B8_9HELO|nr:uncharacterized protein BP5553_02234 [Venustampulla echinocandica]RDL42255.1 hypothetical protein BP5553_02234 [Venustampulla echinocandica]
MDRQTKRTPDTFAADWWFVVDLGFAFPGRLATSFLAPTGSSLFEYNAAAKIVKISMAAGMASQGIMLCRITCRQGWRFGLLQPWTIPGGGGNWHMVMSCRGQRRGQRPRNAPERGSIPHDAEKCSPLAILASISSLQHRHR